METKSALTKNEFPSLIIGKLMTISGILQRESNRLLLPYQLNQQQFSILFEITKAREVQQKNMINRLLLEKAHVSKVVKKLKSMGLIEIIAVPEDKRSGLLSPTPKGQELVDTCRALFQNWNAEWFETFNTEELDQMLESINKLQQAFMHKYSDEA